MVVGVEGPDDDDKAGGGGVRGCVLRGCGQSLWDMMV